MWPAAPWANYFSLYIRLTFSSESKTNSSENSFLSAIWNTYWTIAPLAVAGVAYLKYLKLYFAAKHKHTEQTPPVSSWGQNKWLTTTPAKSMHKCFSMMCLQMFAVSIRPVNMLKFVTKAKRVHPHRLRVWWDELWIVVTEPLWGSSHVGQRKTNHHSTLGIKSI